MRKSFISVVVISFVLIMILSCVAFASQTYYYLAISTSIPWFIPSRQGFEDACESLGVEGKFVGPVDFDISGQVRTLEELISEKPAGIIVHAGDPDAMCAPMHNAIDAGIPILTFGCDVNDKTARYGFVGTNMHQLGEQVAREVVKSINGKGKVAIITMLGELAHMEKVEGIKDTLEKYPEIEILTIEDATLDASLAIGVVHNVLQRFSGEIDVLTSTVSIGSTACARAIKEEGLVGKIKVIATGSSPDILKYIDEGIIDLTLTQNTYLSTWVSTYYLYWLANNSIEIVPNWNWKTADSPTVPPNTYTGCTKITKENLKYFQ